MFAKSMLVTASVALLCLVQGSNSFSLFSLFQQNEATTRNPVVDNVCLKIADGTLLPDPTDSTCFYECSNHQALRFKCPDGLIFVNQAHACGFDPNKPTKKPPVDVVSKYNCTGKSNGFYPEPKDETAFHECFNGLAYDFTCPYPTVFDARLGVCQYSKHPITTTTPNGPTTVTPSPEPTRLSTPVPTTGPTAEPTRLSTPVPTTGPTAEPTRLSTSVPSTRGPVTDSTSTTRGRHHPNN